MIISFDIGIRNLAYCIFDYIPKEHYLEIIDWNCIDILKENNCQVKNCRQIPTERLARFVYETCTRHQFRNLPIKIVLIESQLRRATKNLIIATCVRCYFIDHPLQPRVQFIQARTRLPKYVKMTYKERKQYAIQECMRQLASISLEYLAFFKQFKQKQDDLADCFLQGLNYIYNIKV